MHAALEQHIAAQPRPAFGALVIGATIAAAFAEDRARVACLVDTQLPRTCGMTGTHPRITGAALPQIGVVSGQADALGRDPHRDAAGSNRGGIGLADGARRRHAKRRAPPGTPCSPSRCLRCAGAAIGFGALSLLRGRHGGDATSDAGSAVAAASEPTPSGPAAPSASGAPRLERAPSQPSAARVRLHVAVEPKTARVYLDDVLLSTGSFDGEVARTDSAKQLRVEADRYATREQAVSLANDLTVEVALVEEPRHRGGAARPAATATATSQPGPAGPPEGQRPQREIDRDNPYAKKKP